MKIIILTILSCLVLSFGVNSQDFNVLLAPSDTSQKIKDIDKICHYMKGNLNNYMKIEIFKDSTAFRDVYLKDNVLQMVIVQFIENKIEKNVEWYFSDEQLIYAESYWINTENKEMASNTKCYFSNLHMIAWIDGNKFTSSASSEFKDREKELITYSKTIWVNAMKK